MARPSLELAAAVRSPVTPAARRAPQPHADPGVDPIARALVVLVVVPDQRLRGFLQRLCERRGHSALASVNADDGLRVVSHLSGEPDVVLLDGMLAAGAPGQRAAIERFLSWSPHVPLVVVGGRARDVDIPRLTVHPSAWIAAPFDGDVLVSAIERVADAQSLRGRERRPTVA
jgi:CheY-like chemotaxis protein